MIKADFHLHSSFSGDCNTPMEEQIKKAIDLDLEHVCFTDHLDLQYPKEYGFFDLEVEEYVKQLELMKDKYKEKINIYLGIEFGLVAEAARQYEELVKKFPFDFIIGSTHIIDWKDPYFPDYWEGKSRHQGMVEYFNCILKNIQSYNEFDSLGHLDYIIRYTDIPEDTRRNKDIKFDNFEYKEYKDVLDEILKHLIKHDKSLEINTGGYRHGLGAPNPGYSVLKRYKEMGGKLITIGSDAHKPEHLAFEYHKAKELLLAVGYDKYVIYKNREVQVLAL